MSQKSQTHAAFGEAIPSNYVLTTVTTGKFRRAGQAMHLFICRLVSLCLYLTSFTFI